MDIGYKINIWSVWILLIIENWKHYSKIIFKCVNSAVESNFKENFVEKSTYGSYKQCIEPIELDANATKSLSKLMLNTYY